MTDTALLEKWIAERDAEAFKEITKRYAPVVYGACTRILRNPADAEDVAQECFLALVETRKPPKGSLGVWLHSPLLPPSMVAMFKLVSGSRESVTRGGV